MDIVAIIIMLAVGAVVGWLGGLMFSGHGFGYVSDIILGIFGAVIAGFLLPGIIPIGGIAGQIISAAIGAIILLSLISQVRRR